MLVKGSRLVMSGICVVQFITITTCHINFAEDIWRAIFHTDLKSTFIINLRRRFIELSVCHMHLLSMESFVIVKYDTKVT